MATANSYTKATVKLHYAGGRSQGRISYKALLRRKSGHGCVPSKRKNDSDAVQSSVLYRLIIPKIPFEVCILPKFGLGHNITIVLLPASIVRSRFRDNKSKRQLWLTELSSNPAIPKCEIKSAGPDTLSMAMKARSIYYCSGRAQ